MAFSVRHSRNPEAVMSLSEHLSELRRRLIICIVALAVGSIIGFVWYQTSLPGLTPLGELLRRPYCELPRDLRADFTGDGECRLLATTPFDMFMLRLKISALAGVVLASPVWLYQLWEFVTPGLLKNERRWTISFVSIAVLLFVAGAVLAYFVITYGLVFLLTIGGEFQVAALNGHDYLTFLLKLIVIFGISFEAPLLVIMLNLVGILSYETIKGKRRLIWIILAISAAFLTPGGDPFSMSMLTVALCLLVEASFQFCRLHDRKRAQARPEWMDLDDDKASPLEGTASRVGAPSAVDRPSSIDAPRSLTETGNSHASQESNSTGALSDTNNFDDVL